MTQIRDLTFDNIDDRLAERAAAKEQQAKEVLSKVTPERIYVGIYEAFRGGEFRFSIPLITPEEMAVFHKQNKNLQDIISASQYAQDFKAFFESFGTFEISIREYESPSQNSGMFTAKGVQVVFDIEAQNISHAFDVFKTRREAAREAEQNKRSAEIQQRADNKLSGLESFKVAIGYAEQPQLPAIVLKPTDHVPLNVIPPLSEDVPEHSFDLFAPEPFVQLPLTERQLYQFRQETLEELFFESFSYDTLENEMLDKMVTAQDNDETSTSLSQTITAKERKRHNPIYEAIRQILKGYKMDGESDVCNANSIVSFRPDSFAAKFYRSLACAPQIEAVRIGNNGGIFSGDIILECDIKIAQPKTALSREMDVVAEGTIADLPPTSSLIQDRINRFNIAIERFIGVAERVEGFEPDVDALRGLGDQYRNKLEGTDVILYSQNMQRAVYNLENITRQLGIVNGDIEADRIEKFTLPELQVIEEKYIDMLGLLKNGIDRLDAFYRDERLSTLRSIGSSINLAKAGAKITAETHPVQKHD